jgi:hypothetical protein
VLKLKERGHVAQLVEQRTFNAWVAGSIPAVLTTQSISNNGSHDRLPFVFARAFTKSGTLGQW